MILPDNIIRSDRKTVSLTIKKDGQVIVHAPYKMPDKIINDFIGQKQDWLASKLAIIKNNQDKYSQVLSYQRFLLFGQQYSLKIADVKKPEVVNQSFIIPKKVEQNKILHTLINFYKEKAKEVLFKRLTYLQSILKIKCNSFKISNSKGRWGSCSSSGVITLNWRVIMINPACIDYVIVHELCHLVEMNHSKRFWTLVETFLPNYNQLRQDLKEFGFLLELYRK